MMACLVVAAIITCTGTPARPTSPAEAVRILTSSTRPFTYVAPPAFELPRDVPQAPRAARPWPIGPLPPTQPLAPPWRVTTIERHGVTETFFNGRRVR